MSTNSPTTQQRYDEFQKDAVNCVSLDFAKKVNGRFLLVIPTGGGKTFTAVKSVNRLFADGTLNPQTDRVVWIAHRIELIQQAQETFEKFSLRYPELSCFTANVDFKMISEIPAHLEATPSVRLAVIDEAHHAAAPSYKPIFAKKSLGILGLTATPSRHDGEPLEFERESYSIGFPDLVKKGIVLKPEVRRVEGGNFQISDFDDSSLDLLNTAERNQKIISELLKHPDEYKKVIIYVGTKAHVQSLYQLLKSSALKNKYDSIAYITGDENSRNQERRDFIEQEKKVARAILVNVTVLSEGYDDPEINTVIMATPCKSKLYYMQAMGRAIRHSPTDPLKRAFCVEVVDELPNIRYRIDNRWLYSDVSDTLEPAVRDTTFTSGVQLKESLEAIYNEFSVPAEHRKFPDFDPDQRYSLLLFQRYLAPGKYVHFPILINYENRLQVSNMFNFLSERMESFKARGVVPEAAFQMIGADAFAILGNDKERRWVYQAMEIAVPGGDVSKKAAFEKESPHPWLIFLALHFRQPEISAEILDFVKDMVNRDEILDQVKSREFEVGDHLIRLPLPLKSSFGKIVNSSELHSIDFLVQKIRALRNEKGNIDHRGDLYTLLANSIIPIELAHKDCLILIARTDDNYHLQLH